MKDGRDVFEFGTKDLGYGLVTKTNSQYAFLACIFLSPIIIPDRESGPGERLFIIQIYLREFNFIVATHQHFHNPTILYMNKLYEGRVIE